jgi:hypothetical protein
MILSDLPSPVEAGFAKAGNQYPFFGIMRRTESSGTISGKSGERKQAASVLPPSLPSPGKLPLGERLMPRANVIVSAGAASQHGAYI